MGKDFDVARKDEIIISQMKGYFIIALILILNISGYFEKSMREKTEHEEYFTSVDSTYTDYSNRSTKYLILKNGEKIVNFWNSKEYDIRVRDSLVKIKNSTYLFVFRNKKIKYSIGLLPKY